MALVALVVRWWGWWWWWCGAALLPVHASVFGGGLRERRHLGVRHCHRPAAPHLPCPPHTTRIHSPQTTNTHDLSPSLLSPRLRGAGAPSSRWWLRATWRSCTAVAQWASTCAATTALPQVSSASYCCWLAESFKPTPPYSPTHHPASPPPLVSPLCSAPHRQRHHLRRHRVAGAAQDGGGRAALQEASGGGAGVRAPGI